MTGWRNPEPEDWRSTVDAALREDLGTGDLSAFLFSEEKSVSWFIEAQAEGVVCGVGIAHCLLGGEILVSDGDAVAPGTMVLRGSGERSFVLSRERTALNFLMHLGGVASLTKRFVDAVDGLPVRIVDTRKTLPGLRNLQKYAVRCGGGFSHRMGLYDALMIKDNHIRACGSITAAVERAKATLGHMVKIEVECETIEQAREAVKAKADVVMLDNMKPEEMAITVSQLRGLAVFEASGGVNLATVREIAETGVDVISVGALTHSAPALSLHLEVD